MSEIISVVEMKAGEKGKVVGLDGGQGMIRNMESMGIKIGSRIKKISQQLMKGPVVISHGNTQVGVGRGIAGSLMVEVEPLSADVK
ncbi:MAG: ferrous iron transport protein A [Candidatus Pacebacteria bacterium]|nr:ferrous iron transport protein A [Candidatus Paceibacterota bacterium]